MTIDRNSFPLWTVMVIWLGLRVGLETQIDSPVIRWISDRPELVTPVTGWKQRMLSNLSLIFSSKESDSEVIVVQEGVYLFQEGYDPYDGDVFHQVE